MSTGRSNSEMREIEEIKGCNPFLVTQNDVEWQLHYADLVHTSGTGTLSAEARDYLAETSTPFIDYRTDSMHLRAAAANYPVASNLIHPGPYSALSLAPVDILCSLARGHGFVVENSPDYKVPNGLLVSTSLRNPSKIENMALSDLPNTAGSTDQAFITAVNWAKQLRSRTSDLLEVSTPGNEAFYEARSLHRAHGVVFYHAHMVSAGNYDGAQGGAEIGISLGKWKDHLKSVLDAYPKTGRPEVLKGHEKNFDWISKLHSSSVSKFKGLSPDIGPSR